MLENLDPMQQVLFVRVVPRGPFLSLLARRQSALVQHAMLVSTRLQLVQHQRTRVMHAGQASSQHLTVLNRKQTAKPALAARFLLLRELPPLNSVKAVLLERLDLTWVAHGVSFVDMGHTLYQLALLQISPV
jgi:hypothetical protein